MRFVQDGAARGLVNAAALHADQAVLDHIIQADAVAAADLVQLGDDGRSFQLFAVQLNWHALFKAGAAMADSVRTLGPGDLNHALGQDGPRKAGAEQVALVIRARLHGGDNVVVDKLVGQIFHIQLGRAACLGAFFQAVQLAFLAHVAADGDDLAVIVMLLQPRDDDGCVQTTRVGQPPTKILFAFGLRCYYTRCKKMCKTYSAHSYHMNLT